MMATATQTRQTTMAASPPKSDDELLAEMLDNKSANVLAAKSEFYAKHLETGTNITRALVVGLAIGELRRAIEPLMPIFTKLQGSPLGFKTDKEKEGGYPAEIVREALITGFLMGVRPVGNELNIISNGCYITRHGWERKVREFPGVTDADCIPGIPFASAAHGNQVVCKVALSWKLNGVRQEILDPEGKPGRVFGIRVNSGSTVDANVGKAKAKAWRAAFEFLSGKALVIGDAEDEQQPAAMLTAAANAAGVPSGASSKAQQAMADLVKPNGDGHKPAPLNERTIRAIKKAAERVGANPVAMNDGKPLEDMTQEQGEEMLHEILEMPDAQ